VENSSWEEVDSGESGRGRKKGELDGTRNRKTA
jgi:hypothetical protein